MEKILCGAHGEKFSEQTSFSHGEQVRDGISFGKEEERVSIVISDVQSLNDLQCFVTLPEIIRSCELTMKYESMPKVADACCCGMCRPVSTRRLRMKLLAALKKNGTSLPDCSEGESLIQAVPGGAFINGG